MKSLPLLELIGERPLDDICAATKLHKSQLASYIAGLHIPSPANAHRIAQALGRSAEEVLTACVKSAARWKLTPMALSGVAAAETHDDGHTTR